MGKSIPASIYGYTVSIDCDAAGNVYIAGNFMQVGNFGHFNLLSNSNTYTDGYIAKIDAAGNWIFAQKLNCNTMAELTQMKVTNNGQIFVTGTFRGNMTFGSNIITNNNTFVDVFIAGADSNGNWQWAKQYYGNTVETAYAFAMDVNKATGDIYLTGKFQGTVIFDTDTAIASFNYDDMYVTKTDLSGNLQWLKTTGISDIRGIDISVMNNGNVLIAGYFRDSVSFGTIMLYDTGSNQSFCAELSATGNWEWALGSTTAGLYSAAQINSVTCGPFGNVYLTGQCGFPTSFGNFLLNSIGSQIYIAKINTDSILTGIKLYNASSLLQVWPNPVDNVINIYYPNALKEKSSLYLYNIAGRCVYTKPNCNMSERIDMHLYPAGLYMLKVVDNSRLIIKR
ncbi:MAG TPA: T9SS type A sorting domain-containing protein [Bacteroidia bacterium]|nr:T9SS type A sorting domain-containing protein [Bacteroidia bacterium]HNU33627.1 T9SS type A sorting domain-containing protein [Bacteroidia bacterium]